MMIKFPGRLALIVVTLTMLSGCADTQSDPTQNTAEVPVTPTTETSVSPNQHLAETPLYKAAESNDVARIKQLLAEGADIDLAAGKDQETPLHRAITRGSTEAAKILIESGANINKPRSDGQTPLEMAGVRNRTEVLLFLGQTPTTEASVSPKQQLAETPLYKAAERNDVNLIKQLLADGADIDLAAGRDQETPLHRAITRGSTEAAKILIESGANINQPRSDGQTPLEMARVRNRTKILLLLKDPSLQPENQ